MVTSTYTRTHVMAIDVPVTATTKIPVLPLEFPIPDPTAEPLPADLYWPSELVSLLGELYPAPTGLPPISFSDTEDPEVYPPSLQ